MPRPDAKQVRTNIGNFDGALSGADDTVQKALDTLDDAFGGFGLTTFLVQSATLITRTLATYALATGMTITPGAGTYLVFFSTSASANKNSRTVLSTIFANGVQVLESEREVGGQSNNLGGMMPIAEVTVADGQTIEAHWKLDATTGGPVGTMVERTLLLIRKSIS